MSYFIKILFSTWLFFLLIQTCFSQEISSKNGWYITPKGTIRVLMIYVEIEYDVNPEHDSGPKDDWKDGQLPDYAGDFFDPFISDNYKGKMTRFFDHMSFGNYQVLGDYIDYVVRVKESEVSGFRNIFGNGLRAAVARNLSDDPRGFKTHHNIPIEEFDLWQDSKQLGAEKINLPDTAPSFDHVMLMFRNHNMLNGGYTSQHSAGTFFGYQTDTYSVMTTGGFNLMRHEYCHQLMGGNNFHATGGQHKIGGDNYFLSFQGGWGLMGDANSSLITCNAWDRDRLDWKPKGKLYTISSIDDNGNEVMTDIQSDSQENTLEFWVRDFITYGDAIRLKLPHIPEWQFEQWIWIENHQTTARNASEFDNFQYFENECKPAAMPGIYMYYQVDKNIKEGPDTYSSSKHFGDYIRPILADGNYDLVFTDTLIQNQCINYSKLHGFEKKRGNENPLTGSCDQEVPNHDFTGGENDSPNGVIKADETRLLFVEVDGNEVKRELASLGLPRHAFHLNGNKTIHLGTNPPSSSQLTEVSSYRPRNHPKDNKSIYLNGLKIELIEERSNESNTDLKDIKIRITFDHNRIDSDVRWCGDSIVLFDNGHPSGNSLEIAKKKTLLLDRGTTPVRQTKPDLIDGVYYFNSPTHLHVMPGATLVLEKKSKLHLKKGSRLILHKDSKLILEKKAKVIVDKDCNIDQRTYSTINQRRRARIIYR